MSSGIPIYMYNNSIVNSFKLKMEKCCVRLWKQRIYNWKKDFST